MTVKRLTSSEPSQTIYLCLSPRWTDRPLTGVLNLDILIVLAVLKMQPSLPQFAHLS